jgi:hypothetical protein
MLQLIAKWILFFILTTCPILLQGEEPPSKKRVNVIISSKAKTIDGAQFSFQLQAWLTKLFHKKKLYLFYVDSIEEAASRVSKRLEKENALIDNLWFDGHGHIGRRVAMVEIGKDEVNYQTIREGYILEALSKIASYCDSNTKVSIGSCYSAAVFSLPAVEKFPEQRMNGDSLMIAMANIMTGATVYGTRSWVMCKLGIFSNSYALAGHLTRRVFKDPILEPVWDSQGSWCTYNSNTGLFTDIKTVSLDGEGNILTKKENYLDIKKQQKQLIRKKKKLKAGNFPTSWFYRYELPKQRRSF